MAGNKQTFRIEGLSDVDAALKGLAEEFSVRNAKNVLRGALKDGGKIIAEAEKGLAPKLTGDLAASPQVSTKLSRRQKRANVKESAIEVYVGPTSHPKSVQTEFGNSHQAPEPHLRPAWDANKARVLNLVIDRTKVRLEQTRARLARKAEREAAKLKAR